jgi:hypothetical protein
MGWNSWDGFATTVTEAQTRAHADFMAQNAVPVRLSELGFHTDCRLRDLWTHKDLGRVSDVFVPIINAHGAGLYRVSPGK